MEKIQVIEGNFVSSEGMRWQQVSFDTQSGLILEVGQNLVTSNAVTHRFEEEELIFAGMGDVHIHAREDVSGEHCYKEDFLSASAAALNGGVVHCCDMPNNPVAPIDLKSYTDKLTLALKTPLPLFMYAGIGPGTKPLPLRVPYKAYMGPSVGELFFESLEQLEVTLQNYARADVSFHCEDPQTLEQHKKQGAHASRRPKEAEYLATQSALQLIERFSLKGKLCHYSIGEGLPLIRQARQKALPVQIEVTPQHLYFDQKRIPATRETYFQMNPPIRDKADREALCQALLDGEIDFLATDHAPHAANEKLLGVSGMPGLDTYGAFVCWLIEELRCPLPIIAKICCENPGDFVNQFMSSWTQLCPEFLALGKGLGWTQKNFSASFTVLNPKKKWRVQKGQLKTKAQASPFEGLELPGQVSAVFYQGKRLR